MVLISFKSISPITSPILPTYHHHHHSFHHSIHHLLLIYYKLILLFLFFLIFYLSYFTNLINHHFNQSYQFHSTKSSTKFYEFDFSNQSTTTTFNIPGWIKLNALPITSLLEKPSGLSIQPINPISECESNWISAGIPCLSLQNQSTPLDILWTWVNGTSTQKKQTYSTKQLPDYLFRQHDELRYSIRSVLTSIPSTLINQLHLFTEDICGSNLPFDRFGSIPTWLNTTFIDRQIALHHHSQAFHVSVNYLKAWKPFQNYSSNDHSILQSNSIQWRKSVVPSHNSLAIESQIPHLENLGKTLLYMNDDTFLLRPFSSGDLMTSSYGPVFRIQWDLNVQDRPPTSRPLSIGSNGEWPSLGYSNWLLSNRFGCRDRRYLHHVAKVLPVDSMKELSAIWADELSESASSAFRSQLPEVNLPFLTTWYHIEKHRESILYSYIMLKSDLNSDGKISSNEFQLMLKDLSIKPNQRILQVQTPSRLTNHPNMIRKVLKDSDYPLQTQYAWVSSDGYPLQSNSNHQLPNYSSTNPPDQTFCEIDVEVCFGNLNDLVNRNGELKSEDLFKRIGFEQVRCGDCLVTKIVGESGLANSLEFALPSSTSPSTTWFFGFFKRVGFGGMGKKRKEGVVGVEKSWENLKVWGKNVRGDEKRQIGISLLKKYQYVIGNTPNTFRALTSEIGAKKFLEPLIVNQDSVAMVTVNDLIVESGAIRVFKNWLNQLWSEKLDFEI
ncbi:uncharacterized protein MELLADRAFT_118379 [Melampsora larici-populina 98AG31]|uniref:EF-hand domain-containing protein n=1 Tax=Melampsora larici-populina (strain 98AG31 / pathotype 3-4-7) TaxID=747676 RepID=F4S8K3_MELLP|nr:uncharacterized protein MELLADRAFT_118379 [Melampsora larici-populina 98AG31]EGF99055.1 hypothetical protein MELLADRAFT_118379 [Melampsora larici-populina 98AG31]